MTGKDRVTFVAGLAVLAAAAAMGLGQVFDPATVPGYDFAAYRGAADRLLSGQPIDAYEPDSVRLGPYGQFLYPPPAERSGAAGRQLAPHPVIQVGTRHRVVTRKRRGHSGSRH